MRYEGPEIVLEEVVYVTLGSGSGDGRSVTVEDATYLGVIERKSDGYTVLSMRKPYASRAFNVEVGALISVTTQGSTWEPETHSQRWRLRAAELRAFIEGTEIEDWAKPYFDPSSSKHHSKKPVRDWSSVRPTETVTMRYDIATGSISKKRETFGPEEPEPRRWPEVLPASMPDLRPDRPFRSFDPPSARQSDAPGFMDSPARTQQPEPEKPKSFLARLWRGLFGAR